MSEQASSTRKRIVRFNNRRVLYIFGDDVTNTVVKVKIGY
jgi:hypothetical protein